MASVDISEGRIKEIQFGILSTEQILEISKVRVRTQEPFQDKNVPRKEGLLDSAMGTTDRENPCKTCQSGNRVPNSNMDYH